MGTTVIYRANVNVNNEPKTSAGYARLQRKYEVIPAEQLISVNAEVTPVVSTVSAAATRLVEISAEILQLPGYSADDIPELHDCADGLDFAESQYRTSLKSMNELSDCAQEATDTRDKFVVDLRNSAVHAVIDEGYLKEFSGGPGYTAMINDIRLLLGLYRNHWQDLSGKTCRTLEELDRAEGLIHHMEHLIGLKSLGTAGLTHVAEMRNRAFTYLIKRYDRMCRAVTFVRWDQGDADKFAPSLYANRGSRKKTQPEKEDAEQPQQPAQPVIGANGPFVTTPATPATGGNATPTPVRIAGMPGGSPFIQ